MKQIDITGLGDWTPLHDQVIDRAEAWFEAITQGRFKDIQKRQAELLEVIEQFRKTRTR